MKMFNLFKEESPSIFNHITDEVSIGDVRRFRMPSDGCYNIMDENGQWIFSVIDSLTVLTKDNMCRCLVDFGYRTMEKEFTLGYLERGTIKAEREK